MNREYDDSSHRPKEGSGMSEELDLDALEAETEMHDGLRHWHVAALIAEVRRLRAELERRAKVEKEPTQCQSRHQFSKIKGWDTLARCELKFGHDGEHRATISHGHLEYWE